MRVEQIKRILYRLKTRSTTCKCYLIKESSRTADYAEGEYAVTYATTTVKKAIVLPKTALRHFVYDLSFIAANRNFTTGGLYDRNDLIIMIDSKDLPKNYNIDLNLKVQVANKVYAIVDFTSIVGDIAHIIKLRGVENEPRIVEE